MLPSNGFDSCPVLFCPRSVNLFVILGRNSYQREFVALLLLTGCSGLPRSRRVGESYSDGILALAKEEAVLKPFRLALARMLFEAGLWKLGALVFPEKRRGVSPPRGR